MDISNLTEYMKFNAESSYPLHLDFILAKGYSKTFNFTILSNGEPWTPQGQWVFELLGVDQSSPALQKVYPDGGITFNPETSELSIEITYDEISNLSNSIYGHRLSWIDLSNDETSTYTVYITGETSIRDGDEIPQDLYTINQVTDIIDPQQLSAHNEDPKSHPYILQLIIDLSTQLATLVTTVDSNESNLEVRLTQLSNDLTAQINGVNDSLTSLIDSNKTELVDQINSVESSLSSEIITVTTQLTNLINENKTNITELSNIVDQSYLVTSSKLNSLELSINQLRSEYSINISKVYKLIADTQAEVDSLTEDLSDANQSIQDLSGEVTELSQTVDSNKVTTDTEIKNLSDTLAQNYSYLDSALDNIDAELSRRIHDLETTTATTESITNFINTGISYVDENGNLSFTYEDATYIVNLPTELLGIYNQDGNNSYYDYASSNLVLNYSNDGQIDTIKIPANKLITEYTVDSLYNPEGSTDQRTLMMSNSTDGKVKVLSLSSTTINRIQALERYQESSTEEFGNFQTTVNEKFSEVDTSIENLNSKVDSNKTDTDNVIQSVNDELQSYQESNNTRVTAIESDITTFKAETAQSFQEVNETIDNVSSTLTSQIQQVAEDSQSYTDTQVSNVQSQVTNLNTILDVEGTSSTVLNTINSQLETLETTKVTANPEIEPATAPKITYDSKGLVTGSENLSVDDIPNLSVSKLPVDPSLSTTSSNLVSNSTITTALNTKLSYASTWSSDATYQSYDIVIYSKYLYKSLIDNNINNQPADSTNEYWERLTYGDETSKVNEVLQSSNPTLYLLGSITDTEIDNTSTLYKNPLLKLNEIGLSDPRGLLATDQSVQEIDSKVNTINTETIPNLQSSLSQAIAAVDQKIPILSTDITADSDNNSKATTPLAVVTYVANEIGKIALFSVSYLDQLPETGSPNIIYFIPNSSSGSSNSCDEYMWINDKWEIIGSTQVDLSNYVQFSDLVPMSVAECNKLVIDNRGSLYLTPSVDDAEIYITSSTIVSTQIYMSSVLRITQAITSNPTDLVLGTCDIDPMISYPSAPSSEYSSDDSTCTMQLSISVSGSTLELHGIFKGDNALGASWSQSYYVI